MSKVELDDTGKTVFDNIYSSPDPRAYCKAMSLLDYIIPSQALPMFQQLLSSYRQQNGTNHVKVLDLGSSYGINAALLRWKMKLADYFQLYTSSEQDSISSKQLVARDQQIYIENSSYDHDVKVIGFDVSQPALQYAKDCGLIHDFVQANLEESEITEAQSKIITDSNCIISTGCIGYISDITLEKIIDNCAPKKPWMTHCILRMFPIDDVRTLLEKKGYKVTISPQLVKQRRFSSDEEKSNVLARLKALDINTKGYEDNGWLYAQVLTAIA